MAVKIYTEDGWLLIEDNYYSVLRDALLEKTASPPHEEEQEPALLLQQASPPQEEEQEPALLLQQASPPQEEEQEPALLLQQEVIIDGNSRMAAAVEHMAPMGFEESLVISTVKELLEIYTEDGWLLIEDNYYSVLRDALLERTAGPPQEEEQEPALLLQQEKSSRMAPMQTLVMIMWVLVALLLTSPHSATASQLTSSPSPAPPGINETIYSPAPAPSSSEGQCQYRCQCPSSTVEHQPLALMEHHIRKALRDDFFLMGIAMGVTLVTVVAVFVGTLILIFKLQRARDYIETLLLGIANRQANRQVSQ